MDFSLNEEQRLLRSEIIRFAREELNEGASERDRDQAFARELWQKCGELQLPGLCVPEEFGGAGLDGVSTAVALEALGYGCEDNGLNFSLAAHLLSCVVPIAKFGSDEQKKKYLPGLCDGTLIAANAMTEPESGSDAFNLRTRAEPEGDGFRLNGTKTFITNAPVADIALAFAATDIEKGYHGGLTAFIVDTDTEGLSTSPKFEKMGLRTSPISEVFFEDVFLPESAVIGGIGGGGSVFVHSMEWERACLFALHVGTIERLLEQAVDYARSRRQYGQIIGKFQGVSHRIAEMKVMLEAGRLLTYKSASQLDRSKKVSLDAAISKLFVSESLIASALSTIQVFGGYGFMTETGVERMLRDAVAGTIYSGTSEVQKNIIAGWLGL